jgi:fatty acid desaturase
LARSILKHPSDLRALFFVATYHALLLGMYFVPALRNPVCYVAAFSLSFQNVIVAHNHLHQGMFSSPRANMVLRYFLSFGALYPISTNVPAHNLVHHHFEDDGGPDWADPGWVRFDWNLMNLLQFPNKIGTIGLAGAERWMRQAAKSELRRQWNAERWFSLGLTAVLLLRDFWPALFFVVLPQLWGARSILRLNLLQHEACDVKSEWNHSRNFVGGLLNWLLCNNGYHTIHHNRAGLHWTELPGAHQSEVVPRMDPALDEPNMITWLFRYYVATFGRVMERDLSKWETTAAPVELMSRAERKRAADRAADAEMEALTTPA